MEFQAYSLDAMLTDFAEAQRIEHATRIKYSIWKSLKEMVSDNQPFKVTKSRNAGLTILTFSSFRRRVDVAFEENQFFCDFAVRYFDKASTKQGAEQYEKVFKAAKLEKIERVEKEKTLYPTKKQNVEENKNMMNIKGFEFGVVKSPSVRLSHLGVAIRNKMGVFVSFDAKKGQLIDVDLFDFDMDGMIYKMPVAIKDVKVGDVIIHNTVPMIVTALDVVGSVVDSEKHTTNFNSLTVVDPVAGESKTIMPTRNMFGFDFVTKIVSLIDMNTLGANEDSPFGNMLPLMMMSGMKGNGNKMESMLPMLMMSQMSGGKNDMFSNPLMMMAMMGGEGDSNSMLPMLMMSGMLNK